MINSKIDDCIQRRLNIKKTYFEIDFEGICKQLLDEWIGKYDGVTKYGATFHLIFNGIHFTTGENAAIWVLWILVNNGNVKNWLVHNEKYRVQGFMIRSVGAKANKVRVRGDFTWKNPNDDWVPMK